MSRFNAQDVAGLVLRAVRLPVDTSDEQAQRAQNNAPLLGKETALLAALQKAEAAHDEHLAAIGEERGRIKALADARGEAKRLADHLGAALYTWSAMSDEARASVAWFAHASGNGAGEWDGTDRYLGEVTRDLHQRLRAVHTAAVAAFSDIKFAAGRTKGISQSSGERTELGPLIAFASVLRDFWQAETGDSRFGYEDGTRDQLDGKLVPVSAPARLVWEASQFLDPDYTLPNIETVFVALNAGPAKG